MADIPALTAPLILIREPTQPRRDYDLQARVAQAAAAELEARVSRDQFIKRTLFGDPAWEILLELFNAENDGVRLMVGAIGVTTDIKPTTVLRWLSVLEKEHLVTRHRDPLDARRIFISLTEKGSRSMTDYFEHRLVSVVASRVATRKGSSMSRR